MKKKLNLQLGNIREMMSREQMKSVVGGYNCRKRCGTCSDNATCAVATACTDCYCGNDMSRNCTILY